MVNFANPGVLGLRSHFRRYFELPILEGREPDASQDSVDLGKVRSEELSALVNDFILRRTNDLLSKHLPPKVTLGSVSIQLRFPSDHRNSLLSSFASAEVTLHSFP